MTAPTTAKGTEIISARDDGSFSAAVLVPAGAGLPCPLLIPHVGTVPVVIVGENTSGGASVGTGMAGSLPEASISPDVGCTHYKHVYYSCRWKAHHWKDPLKS